MITQITNGSIDASWVLVIITSIAGTMALIFLNDIRSSIKSIVAHQNEQDVKIAQNDARVEFAHERIDELKEQIS